MHILRKYVDGLSHRLLLVTSCLKSFYHFNLDAQIPPLELVEGHEMMFKGHQKHFTVILAKTVYTNLI